MKEIKHYETEEIERSRKKIRNGDVFVVKIKDYELYFYGKVIDVNANYNNITKPIFIFLYKTPTTKIITPDNMDENDIMTIMLSNQYGWRCGHFKTICNIPIKNEELSVDYGFLSTNHGNWIKEDEVESHIYNHEILYLKDGRIIAEAYVDAYNNILDHKPKITSRYYLSFYNAVSEEISKYLHKNPDIKRKYGLE